MTIICRSGRCRRSKMQGLSASDEQAPHRWRKHNGVYLLPDGATPSGNVILRT
ncbi:hypothetical protein KCP78_08700 [Salmonella enterica subsp. enterica]|nr:hypothetical protein KCP78_08700 [Salmonella enterica subsp. enterica]